MKTIVNEPVRGCGYRKPGGFSSAQDKSDSLFCGKCHGAGTLKVPGVFTAFVPQRIEYIITGKESQEELDRKEKAGITLIKLERTDGVLIC